MVNTADGGADYPPEVPLEDEPERFIEGSDISDELETEPLESSSDTDDDDEPTDDDFAQVNDG
ncbi:hypothetical protein [Rathayibacter soli]|uniref:hypothetical protein n=1 Tax=Rathayibacter soli TaxID=3144168 RepID=UPI0027E494EE|nr:hypothetical protein [Glaciibacter superstes]